MTRVTLVGCVVVSVWCVSHVAAADGGPTNLVDRPAVFHVTPDVVNADVAAFTATIGKFGNSLKREGKGGFEPGTFRTKLTALGDSPNRVYGGTGSGLTYYDTFSSGYLDGAEVRVYRIIDGKMTLVRQDIVAPGGCVLEYWDRNDRDVIDPGTTSAQFEWDDYNRPSAERWFTVFAVDAAGNLSPAAKPVKLRFTVADKGVDAKTKTTRFRATGAADEDAPPAPTHFRAVTNAQGIVEMSWDAVQADDLAGYRIAKTDTDPSTHRGIYLELAGDGDPIKAGDMVFVSKSLAGFSGAWLSNRLGGLARISREYQPQGVPNDFFPDAVPGKTWRLVRHPADTPVKESGEYYFEMTLREGDTELVGKTGIPDISTTKQNYYPVPEDGAEYVMEVWMKADRDDAPPVVFTWDGDKRVGGFVGKHPFQLTTEWKRYEARFTGKSTAKGYHAYFVLQAQGPATYSFDNFHIHRADVEYLDFLPYQYEYVKASGVSAIRTHAPIKTGHATYSMRQFVAKAGQAQGIPMGNTLAQTLRMIEKAGVRPWLQVEFHMSPEEWLGFVEYLAAPYDPAKDTPESKPWAYLRYQQGRPAPWTDAFDRIYFELGNETWNRLFRPWVFGGMTDASTGKHYPRGAVYGLFHDHVVSILRSSPYWSDDLDEKFIQVLGGWTIGSYNQEAAGASKTAEFITMGGYNGGWDEGEGPPQQTPASYFNVLSQVNTAVVRAKTLAAVTLDASADGHAIRPGVYEAGPGYALNGLNNAKVTKEQAEQQELVMKSKLAGTATIDSFLIRAYCGFEVDNFFTLAEGDRWSSHAKKHRGGQAHACFLPLQMFNNHATGDLLRVETISVPTVDLVKSRRRNAAQGAPLATVYATHSGDRVSLFCISRRIPDYPRKGDDGYTPMEVKLPFTKAKSIKLLRLTGKPTDTNIYEENVKVETVTIDPSTLQADGTFTVNQATGADAKGLAPSEVYLYVFEGVTVPKGRTIPLAETIDQPATFSAAE